MMKLNKSYKTVECLDKIREAITNPNNSIILILGIPFIFALIWVFFEKGSESGTPTFFIYFVDSYFIYLIIIGPFIPLFVYSYYTKHKVSSAIFGFLLYPLIFLQTDILTIILDFGFEQAINRLTWSYISNLVWGVWPFSIIHALIGFLVAYRKQTYLVIAFLLFVVHVVVFYFAID